MNFFGSSKKAPAPAPAQRQAAPQKPVDTYDTIQTLKKSSDDLDKRIQNYQKKIEQQQKIAKQKIAKKDKQGAMMCLKRKKMYENEITKIEGIQVTLETQMMSLESAQTNATAYQAISIGTKSIAAVNQSINVENVETTIEDLQEQMDDANEVSNALSQGIDTGLDEGDLEDEFAELMGEAAGEDLGIGAPLSTVPAMPEAPQESILNFPTAPTEVPTEASSVEDDAEMQQLAAAMGL